MDKKYDYPQISELVEDYGYITHIRVRGQQIQEKQEIPGFRTRRWVVERTHSWLNRFRRILVRREKKAENYIAFLCLACAVITLKACGLSDKLLVTTILYG